MWSRVLYSVNLKKASLWLTGHKFITRGQQPLLTEASPALCISGKSHRLSFQASWIVLLLSDMTYMRELLVSSFNQCTETCPNQLELCTTVSSFALTLTNQRSSMMTNWSAWSWPIRTVLFESIRTMLFGFLICIKMNQLGIRAGTSLSKVPSLLTWWSTLWVFIRGCFPPVCKLFS